MTTNNNQTNTDLSLSNSSNELSTPKLTTRARLFLELLSQGKDILLAYREAGYKGSSHAAYELKSSLKLDYAQLLNSKGFDIESLSQQILSLSQLPLSEIYKQGVNLDQKLKILQLHAKVLKDFRPERDDKKQITAFIVSKSSDGQASVITANVQDAEIVPEDK